MLEPPAVAAEMITLFHQVVTAMDAGALLLLQVIVTVVHQITVMVAKVAITARGGAVLIMTGTVIVTVQPNVEEKVRQNAMLRATPVKKGAI